MSHPLEAPPPPQPRPLAAESLTPFPIIKQLIESNTTQDAVNRDPIWFLILATVEILSPSMTSPIRRSIQPGGNRKIMESGRQKIWRKKIISLNPPDHRHREIYLSDFLSFSLSLCLSKRNQRNWARKDRFPPCGNGVTNAIYPPCLLLITSICLFFLSNTVGSLGIIIKIIIKSELDCFFFLNQCELIQSQGESASLAPSNGRFIIFKGIQWGGEEYKRALY